MSPPFAAAFLQLPVLLLEVADSMGLNGELKHKMTQTLHVCACVCVCALYGRHTVI